MWGCCILLSISGGINQNEHEGDEQLILLTLTVSLIQLVLCILLAQVYRYIITEEQNRQNSKVLNNSLMYSLCKSRKRLGVLITASTLIVFTLTCNILPVFSSITNPSILEKILVVIWFQSFFTLILSLIFLTYTILRIS